MKTIRLLDVGQNRLVQFNQFSQWKKCRMSTFDWSSPTLRERISLLTNLLCFQKILFINTMITVQSVVLLLLLTMIFVETSPNKKRLNINGKGNIWKKFNRLKRIVSHWLFEGAWAYSTEIKIQCFSADSLVKLSNGKEKQIGLLRSSEEIFTIDQSKLVPTEMIMMLDQQISTEGMFQRKFFHCLTFIWF